MAGLQCNKFRGDKGKIIMVPPIRVVLQIQGEILQVGMKEYLIATTAKEKAMLAEAQEAGQILDEEQLAFLADPGIPASQSQIVIPHNASFQTENLDTYDSDCNNLLTAQAVLMANISNYGSDVISEVIKIHFTLGKLNDKKPPCMMMLYYIKNTCCYAVIDDEETFDLEEESRSKMFEKEKDPEVIAKKISQKPN
ncbi:hypothetical protein Tco_1046629 [Tanacetum coccineum]